jgi:Flp pilus assembly pilin Flp
MIQGKLLRLWAFLVHDERGASMVEYALLVLLIAIVALLAVTFAGTQLSETYSDINSGLEWASNQA